MPEAGQTGLSVQAHLRRRYDAVAAGMRFRGESAAEARAWQRRARRRFARLLGLDTMTRCGLDPRVAGRVDAGDHWREDVALTVEPGLTMPVYVLVPKGHAGPLPVVVAPHGHGGGGRVAVAGLADTPAVAAAIEKYNYAYGPELCRAGFIVFCPEARGFGARRETLSQGDPLAPSCQWINHMALPLGQTVTGMWVWDLMRLIDYIATRPDCDPRRIGCAGLSGGGLQSMWTAALDARIRATVNSGYFYGFKEALLDKHHNCSCNYVPHLCEHFDMGDIGALLAPRPFLVQSGTEDSHNGVRGMANVDAQVAVTRRAYEAFGAPHQLEHDVVAGPHRWSGTRPVAFLRQALAKGR